MRDTPADETRTWAGAIETVVEIGLFMGVAALVLPPQPIDCGKKIGQVQLPERISRPQDPFFPRTKFEKF